eukprot:4431985-Pyramimonas_sp.AAC.1
MHPDQLEKEAALAAAHAHDVAKLGLDGAASTGGGAAPAAAPAAAPGDGGDGDDPPPDPPPDDDPDDEARHVIELLTAWARSAVHGADALRLIPRASATPLGGVRRRAGDVLEMGLVWTPDVAIGGPTSYLVHWVNTEGRTGRLIRIEDGRAVYPTAGFFPARDLRSATIILPTIGVAVLKGRGVFRAEIPEHIIRTHGVMQMYTHL